MQKKETQLIRTIINCCSDEYPHKYSNLKICVLNKMRSGGNRLKWELRFDEVLNELVNLKIIIQVRTLRFIVNKDIKMFIKSSLHTLNPENKNVFFSDKEECAVTISHMRIKSRVIRDASKLVEGKKYDAALSKKKYSRVKVLEKIDTSTFIGIGKDGLERPYKMSNS